MKVSVRRAMGLVALPAMVLVSGRSGESGSPAGDFYAFEEVSHRDAPLLAARTWR